MPHAADRAHLPPQAVGIWKGYVNQMAVLLVDNDAGAAPSTMATLQRLVQELVRQLKPEMRQPESKRLWNSPPEIQTPRAVGFLDAEADSAKPHCLSQIRRGLRGWTRLQLRRGLVF